MSRQPRDPQARRKFLPRSQLLQFCALVHNGADPVQSYIEATGIQSKGIAKRQAPLLLAASDVQAELSRLASVTPDNALLDECRRLALDSSLRPADRLKALQTYERMAERAEAGKDHDGEAVGELRSFIQFAIQGRAEQAPFAVIQ